MRSNEVLWRASFGVMVGLVLASWLWIMGRLALLDGLGKRELSRLPALPVW